MAFVCSLAGFAVRIDNRFSHLLRQCGDYLLPDDAPADYVISVTDDDLAYERDHGETAGHFSGGYLESLAVYRKLASAIPLRDAFLLHGSVIDCAGRGIAFLARSGVGKTTHTLLWKNEYPSDVTVINGDKPLIRLEDGVPYAYGTPWAGKEGMQINGRTELSDVCFITRGEENSCREITPGEAAAPLLGQIYIPREAEAAAKALSLADRLLKCCRVWEIVCNMDPEAAHTAHDSVFGGKK